MGDFRKKYPDFEGKNILQGNTCHTMALYVILSPEVWEKKNSYPNQITHTPPPPPPSKVKWSAPYELP